MPFCILTDCIEATGRGRQIALVDVPALAARQPLVHLLVAGLALALIAALRVEAFSAAAADVAIFAFIHVCKGENLLEMISDFNLSPFCTYQCS